MRKLERREVLTNIPPLSVHKNNEQKYIVRNTHVYSCFLYIFHWSKTTAA